MTLLHSRAQGVPDSQTAGSVPGATNREPGHAARVRAGAVGNRLLDTRAQGQAEEPDRLSAPVETGFGPDLEAADHVGSGDDSSASLQDQPIQAPASMVLDTGAFSPLAQASSSVLSDMPARAVESAGASFRELNVSTGTLVAAGAALVGLAAAGGGGSSAPRNQTGVVQDGLVKDATVFIDLNRNGIQDTGEPSAKTDTKGSFTITSDASGTLVATGGINIDTGSANTIVLKAQPGSTVINPITTLVNALVVEQSLTAAAAETAVKSALGLDAKLNLSTYDPFAGSGDAAYQKVAAEVAVLAATVAGATANSGGAAAFTALATTIKQSSAALDLTKAATLSTVFASVPVIVAQSADLAQQNAAIATATRVADIPQKVLDYGVSQLALSLKVDSGSATDRVTNAGALVLKDLTGAVTNPSGLQYSIDGGKSFKADLTTFVPVEGANSVVLRLIADNGLASKSSAPFAFTLDTQVSVPVVGIASGSVGGVVNDSGLSSTDGITNVANPVLAGSAEAGAAIEIVVAGVTLKTTADSAGRWTATLPSGTTLADGTPDVAVTITDIAGNAKSATSKAGFTIDTKAPVSGTGGLTATAVNDTGLSASDGITANNRPQLSGTAEAGSSVSVDVGVGAPYLTTATSAGAWSVDVRAGGELNGTVTPKITVTDVAGNAVTSNGTPLTVDTVAPATPTLALRVDSGISATDKITNTAASALDFTAGGLETGARVEFSLGGGAWSQTIKPVEGANSVQVRAVDAAGNISGASTALTFTLDTVAPIATGVTGGLIHDEVNDTGVDVTDGITANLAPSLAGTAPVGSYVQVDFDAATVFKLTTPVGADGKWTIPVELSYGDWTPSIRISDVAGNLSTAVTGATFSIQPEGPYEGPYTVELAHTAVSDTGSSTTDNLTKNATPFLTGVAGPRSTVTIEVNGVSYPVTTDRKGVYTIQVTAKLADGEYTPSIIALDADGVPLEPVSGPAFVIDTVASTDALSGHLVHDVVNDTGSDPTDNRTGNAAPTLEGTAEPGATLTVSFAGSTKTFALGQPVGDDGTWQLPVTLSNGTWTPRISVTDVAGNTLKTPFLGEPFSIDTVAPTATGGLLHDENNDTGSSQTDGITSNPHPTLVGTTEPGATLTVKVGTQTFDAFVETDTGNWTLDLADNLADGTYTPLLIATDEFGNASASIKGTPFTIDTKAPVFQGQLDTTFVVGATNVSLSMPTRAAGSETLIYSAEDLTGNLAAMGLTVNATTGAVTGAKVLSASSTDPTLYHSWVRVAITDLAGNTGTDEFQISVVDEVKAAATTYTLDTNYFESTTPLVSMYPGTSDAQTVEFTQSYGDVIVLAGGNDTININSSDVATQYFIRADGGDGTGDKIAYKLAGTTDLNLGDFNRADSGLGQVLVHFETIDATAPGVNLNLTVTPQDLYLQHSDLLDTSTTGGSRSTLIFTGNSGDTLNLPVVDFDSSDAQDQDFVRIGSAGAWSATGAAGTGYTKLQGVVTFEGSIQSVELLVSQAITITTDINLGRVYPVIGV